MMHAMRPASTSPFHLVSDYSPTGDQPAAIGALTERINAGEKYSCLLGATGTGKTFTMANIIQRTGLPTLILSHNKTLAAQLYEEMRELFPQSAVSYFVSYYDYYQPEAYIPQRDIYIEKDAQRNDDLDRLRLAATSSLLSRPDCIVVASVSCIYGLGSPEAYYNRVVPIRRGETLDRRQFLLAISDMQYKRAEIEFKRGTYRVRGDTIDLYPAYEQFAVRVELFGDTIESIALINPTSGEVLAEESMFFVFPAVHYVMPEDHKAAAVQSIRDELDARVMKLRNEGKLLEAQRLLARTKYDLEMIEEVGYCSGVENYSRHFDGRSPGEPPYTLLDYFNLSPGARGDARHESAQSRGLVAPGQEDPLAAARGSLEEPRTRTAPGNWLLIVDESHVTVPQVRAMYNGDQARKGVLVEHGFRLPSALDNRPLKFEEFEAAIPQVLFVSATPAPYELEKTGGEVVEQIIRPTGLLDPVLHVRPAGGQVPDLLKECKDRAAKGERVLVTALTKRLCEDLTNYLHDQGLKVRYLHSEIETLDRIVILRELREGEFDVLVGVNLLREGLDLPEVSLVCILDADKTGFLRSPTSLIQTIGRAARNSSGNVILYADQITPAMQAAMDETERRRVKQIEYNRANNITPETIKKAIRRGIELELRARQTARQAFRSNEAEYEVEELTRMLEAEMLEAAEQLEFEKAAAIRDQVKKLKAQPVTKSKIKRSELDDAAAGAAGGERGRSPRKGKPGMPGSRAGKPRKRR